MKRFKVWGVALAAVAVALAVAYFWSDRRQIRRQLDALAETASVTGAERDLDRLVRAARLGGFFTEDVVIRRSEDNSAFVGGRPAVAAMAMQAVAGHRTMKVSIANVVITIADRENATADMTVVVSTNNAEVEEVDLREVAATFRKVNGTWLIAQAQVLPARSGTP